MIVWIDAAVPPTAGPWDVFLLAVRHPATGVDYYITGLLDPRGWFVVPPGHTVTRYAWVATLAGPTTVGQLDFPPGR